MQNFSLLFTSFAVLIGLFILHLVGSFFYLYWSIGWYDTLAHLIGGVFVGLFALWVFWDSGLWNKQRPSQTSAFLTAVLVTVVVGVGWEIFEYVYGLTQSTEGYGLDTVTDLIADIVGGTLAGIWGTKKIFYAS
ncbi:MAG: hypothetical protein WD874_00790 [Parcubacteria group bacterium]